MDLMDLETEFITDKPNQGYTKKVKVVDKDVNKEILVQMSKLCLSNALQVRTLRAVSIECFRIPADSHWIVACKESTQKWTKLIEAAKDAGPAARDKIGPPHVYVINAIFKRVLEVTKDTDTELHTKMSNACSQWSSWKDINDVVKHAKVSKMYQQDVKRLEVACPMSMVCNLQDSDHITPAWMWLKAKSLLLKDSTVRELAGMAPKGDLERKLQDFVDAAKA